MMCLMQFCFIISHIFGKEPTTADILSWAPVRASLFCDEQLIQEVTAYVSLVCEN